MARARKKRKSAEDTFHGPRFAQQDVQLAFGRMLSTEARILEFVARNLEVLKEGNGTRAMDGIELQHLQVAREELGRAEVRLRGLSKRLVRKASR